jgi:hypothetical protein
MEAAKKKQNSFIKLAPPVSKPVPKPRARKASPVKGVNVLDQLRLACKRENALGTGFGFVIGGAIPVGIFSVAHYEAGIRSWHEMVMLVICLGGLLFSAKTVVQWAHEAFDDRIKAVGFVVILEGIMTLSHLEYLTYGALCILTIINAVATGITVNKRIEH